MSRLIETKFPYARLSVVAEAESWRKEVYRPVYYMHKWWARRLGSVFRGILLGACLNEGEDFWSRFYGTKNLSVEKLQRRNGFIFPTSRNPCKQ